jgi:hypothetical protein
MQGVVRHRGEDIVLYIRLHGCICQRSTDGDFIPPKRGIDECQLNAREKILYQPMIHTLVLSIS